ncbi:MAG: hypothetical protein ABI912_10630 [Actinomycetota bacterium]
MRWAFAAVGAVLILVTLDSVFRSLVVPRGLSSRLTGLLAKTVIIPFRWLGNRHRDDYLKRDGLLALQAPIAILVQLLGWMLLLLLGFALVQWPLGVLSLGDALRLSGSSLLTLGFASTDSVPSTIACFMEAGSGLIVVALQIGYLPTLYAAFNRRETLVTRLQSRAGEPAWGPEILARHRLVATLDSLPLLYDDWETWAADVAESHSNYRALIWFRSPHPLRSWVVGLVAVLDSAALYLAVNPSTAPSEARLVLRMGFTALRDIGHSLGMAYDPDPRPDAPISLSYEDFLTGIERLERGGFEMERTPSEAWPHFRGWRVNYEDLAYRLADAVDAVPAPWSGPRRGVLAPMAIVRPINRVPEAPEEDYAVPQIGINQLRPAPRGAVKRDR